MTKILKMSAADVQKDLNIIAKARTQTDLFAQWRKLTEAADRLVGAGESPARFL